jgi:hypothetical protein
MNLIYFMPFLTNTKPSLTLRTFTSEELPLRNAHQYLTKEDALVYQMSRMILPGPLLAYSGTSINRIIIKPIPDLYLKHIILYLTEFTYSIFNSKTKENSITYIVRTLFFSNFMFFVREFVMFLFFVVLRIH